MLQFDNFAYFIPGLHIKFQTAHKINPMHIKFKRIDFDALRLTGVLSGYSGHHSDVIASYARVFPSSLSSRLSYKGVHKIDKFAHLIQKMSIRSDRKPAISILQNRGH